MHFFAPKSSYTLKEEWEYVTGAVQSKRQDLDAKRLAPNGKVRDEGRDDWTLDDFVKHANTHNCTTAAACEYRNYINYMPR